MKRKNNVAVRQLNDNIDHRNVVILMFADEVKYFSLEHA